MTHGIVFDYLLRYLINNYFSHTGYYPTISRVLSGLVERHLSTKKIRAPITVQPQLLFLFQVVNVTYVGNSSCEESPIML